MPNSFKSVFNSLSSTSGVTLYTAPLTTTSVVKSLYAANVSGVTSAAISVFVGNSGSASNFYIIKDAEVPIQSSLQAITEPIVLEANDRIMVQASIGNYFDVVLSYMEVT